MLSGRQSRREEEKMAEQNASKSGMLLDIRRVKWSNVARKMKETLINLWSFKNVWFFFGSVAMMHWYGDELAV